MLSQNYKSVQEQLLKACRDAHRDPDSVNLLAVSKTHAAASIEELYDLGVRDFGENYAQELMSKGEELADLDIRWHYIGHLQSNKIAKLVPLCHRIDTVATVEHATKVARAAELCGKAPFPILLEVNLDGESAKAGCALKDVPELVAACRKIQGIRVEGLFSVPAPLTATEQTTHEAPERYLALKGLVSNLGLHVLSLGMSSDLAQAIAAGSTEVRIGTALFGARPNRVL